MVRLAATVLSTCLFSQGGLIVGIMGDIPVKWKAHRGGLLVLSFSAVGVGIAATVLFFFLPEAMRVSLTLESRGRRVCECASEKWYDNPMQLWPGWMTGT